MDASRSYELCAPKKAGSCSDGSHGGTGDEDGQVGVHASLFLTKRKIGALSRPPEYAGENGGAGGRELRLGADDIG